VKYRGYDILELPPNCQGITASIAINIMEGFEPMIHGDPYTVHRQIESIKLAFADANEYVADPNYLAVKVEDLLSKEYAAKRRALIGDYAILPEPGEPRSGGTVYLAAADGQGNMISLIQSVAGSWGSGVVVPGTGILMQNRGQHFRMDENHPNSIGPRKRSYNTIIPGFISKDGQPVGPMGVMGGYMQPQGHLQVTMNMIDYGMNPQAALDAPRFAWQRGKLVFMQYGWPQSTLDSLTARGHEVQSRPPSFGRGQIIVRMENGILCGGTEPRGGSISAF
jgi:gamma-glutamyltranspeptidase/glutathione hydrolase